MIYQILSETKNAFYHTFIIATVMKLKLQL